MHWLWVNCNAIADRILPDQPDRHSQVNSPTSSEQMAPFRHGFGVHSFRSVRRSTHKCQQYWAQCRTVSPILTQLTESPGVAGLAGTLMAGVGGLALAVSAARSRNTAGQCGGTALILGRRAFVCDGGGDKGYCVIRLCTTFLTGIRKKKLYWSILHQGRYCKQI